MLLSLKIKNYALINELHVDFNKGLNIITGETGAGKSILLGALGLILGKRADTSVLSNRESKCIIEAEFDLSGYAMQKEFIDSDIDFDVHTIIRREVLSSGKSRAFINDTPVNLNILQDITIQLVDIHSQHQNLLLNRQSYLLNFIDSYCNSKDLLTEYQNVFEKFKNAERTFLSRTAEYEKVKAEFDFVSHQVEELEKAKIISGELESLDKELYQQEHSEELKTIFHEATEILNGEDSGLLDRISYLESRFTKIEDVMSPAGDIFKRLQSVSIELKDMEDDISKIFESLDFDPERLEQIRNRVDLLNTLLQKYRCKDENELLKLYNQQKEKLNVAIDGEFELEKLKKELNQLKDSLYRLAKQLSEKRTSEFTSIQKKLESILKELGMEYSRVIFESTHEEPGYYGIDNINLLFSANKNYPEQEISKIASGGELSRLMLSVKSLIAEKKGLSTLILDEIDTGVSGEIADKVGNIIKNMSNTTQIINITHLPQVASKGQVHFLVYKDHESEITNTLIKQLSENERLQEIAKMLSGEQLTDAAIENAKVLLGK